MTSITAADLKLGERLRRGLVGQMTNTLTIKDLRAADACEKQVKLFEQHFGDGGTVTLAKVRKVASLFDWNWAALHLLSPAGRAEYNRATAPALAEYNRAIAPAWAEYNRAIAPALAEYNRAIAPAWAEYDRVTASAGYAEYDRVIASARAEYYRVTASAWAEYKRATAPAWFAGWKKDRER